MWEARRVLVGPQQERTDILWVQATHANGFRAIPADYWAGVFVLEAARFLFPKVHFGLIDNDCVPVTFFEVQDLIALAENQFRWPDLIGYKADPDLARSKPGMLLFTEAHLEYNAGLVISIGSPNRPNPIESTSTAEDLAEELEDCRQQLLAMAAPPECPTEASQSGSRSLVCQWSTPWTWPLWGHCMAHTCAINFGRCQAVGKGTAATTRLWQRSRGRNEPTQEPLRKLGKSARPGLLAGPEPLLSKDVCQCCRILKDPVRLSPSPGNTFFKQVELHQIA